MTTQSENLTLAFQRVAQEIKAQGNSSGLVFMQIISSLMPLSDDSLVLLDGTVLYGNGVYGEAVTKIAAMKTANPDMFLTETAWQEKAAKYGECEKFVLGESDGVTTVRLPRLYDTWHKLRFYMVLATPSGGVTLNLISTRLFRLSTPCRCRLRVEFWRVLVDCGTGSVIAFALKL